MTGWPCVLVAEDDAAIRRLLVEALAREGGYPVVVARDGAEALRRARAARPAVVLLDILLPRLDGWAVARRLKADPATAGAWIIGMSAHGRSAAALCTACDQFQPKPLRIDEVLAAVAARLTGRGTEPGGRSAPRGGPPGRPG
jgi:CheY-like chemotaxis protein